MKSFIKSSVKIIVGSVLYLIVFQFLYVWLRYGFSSPIPLNELLLGTLVSWIPILYLVAINNLIIFKLDFGLNSWQKIICDLLLSLLSLLILNVLFRVLTGLNVDYAATIVCDFLLFLGLQYAYYQKISKRSIEKQALAVQQALRYKYEAIKAQINPHFLFNSLNILYSLIDIDVEKSKYYVLNLSRVYRYILNSNDKNEVSLGEELSFLMSYIDVLKARYCENLNVEISESESEKDKMLIPYTLQLLVENVIKHNIISSQSPMTVKIEIFKDRIEVSNKIIKKKADLSTHIGTTYLSKLYSTHGLNFTSEIKDGVYRAIVPFLN